MMQLMMDLQFFDKCLPYLTDSKIETPTLSKDVRKMRLSINGMQTASFLKANRIGQVWAMQNGFVFFFFSRVQRFSRNISRLGF